MIDKVLSLVLNELNVFLSSRFESSGPHAVEMINLTMQDLNNLWSISGSKYLPSASYKLRMVTTL